MSEKVFRRLFFGFGLAAMLALPVSYYGTRYVTTASAGGALRFYQVATPELPIFTVPPYGNSAPRFSWVIDRPGTIKSIAIAPATEIEGSMEDRVVGSIWVNGSETGAIDDVFAIITTVPAMHLTTLATIGMPTTYDLPVVAGDVVTILLGDEGAGAPPLPAATWILGVQE